MEVSVMTQAYLYLFVVSIHTSISVTTYVIQYIFKIYYTFNVKRRKYKVTRRVSSRMQEALMYPFRIRWLRPGTAITQCLSNCFSFSHIKCFNKVCRFHWKIHLKSIFSFLSPLILCGSATLISHLDCCSNLLIGSLASTLTLFKFFLCRAATVIF